VPGLGRCETPNKDKLDEYRERRERIEAQLAEVKASRERIARNISRGTITDEDAATEMDSLKEREAILKDELSSLQAHLENVVDPEEVKRLAEQVGQGFKHRYVNAKLEAQKSKADSDLSGMSWEDKRALLQMVFAGKTADKKRMGVYVQRIPGRERGWKQSWNYRILGRVTVDVCSSTVHPRPDPREYEFLGGPKQRELLSEGSDTTSASSPRRRTRSSRSTRRCSAAARSSPSSR
jgi:hypothetical protein